MKTKRFLVVLFLLLTVFILNACGQEGTITYKGEDMRISEAEEQIADELEVENPDLDLEINIYEETDD